MKLSKKIGIIFIISTITSIALYTFSSNIMMKYFYSGEVSRVSGSASDCIDKIVREEEKVVWKSKDYISFIESAYRIQEKYGKDVSEELEIENKLKSDTIDFKVYFSNKFEILKTYRDITVDNSQNEDIDVLIKKIADYSKGANDKSISGLIEANGDPYIVTMNPVYLNKNGEIGGYFAAFERVGQNYINIIGINMDKNVKLMNKIEEGDESHITLESGKEITVITTNDKIKAYYEMPLLAGDRKFYLEITEPIAVKAGADNSHTVFLIVQIAISLVMNIILYNIIEKLVVRRIYKVNECINRINSTKSLKGRVTDMDGKDEIAKLTRDINNMFETLQDSNETIVRNEIKYSKLLNSLTDGFAYLRIINKDDEQLIDAEIIDSNKAFADLVDPDDEEIEGRILGEKIRSHVDEFPIVTEILDSIYKGEINFVKEPVNIKNKLINIVSYCVEEGYFALIMTDVTENKKYSEEMRYLANYDVLTGLPNRYNLFNYMGQLKYEGKEFTIFFIDLDDFKNINDTLGHNSGDEVLCEAANALRSLSYENLNIGRLGGDEFLVVREGVTTTEDIQVIGSAILASLNKTYTYNNYTYELKASVGVSSSPQHTSDLETLIKFADIAMYKSKSGGGDKIEVFSDDMLEEINIETKLKKAIENKEFVAYYQPIYCVGNDKVCGAEALVRWIDDGKLIQPYKFISIAKKTGYISEIDNFVLEEACKFCRERRDDYCERFEVSVNASYRFLKQPDLMERLENVLKKNNLEPSALKLEITEDEVLDNPEYIITILEKIRAMGIKVALDDFGVGYSSFNHIKMLPIDTIKIDRSLLLTVEEDKKTLAIINTLIRLSHTLDLDVICEGVEIKAQLSLLRELKCDKIQGYLVSKPVTKGEFYDFIKMNN